MEDNAVKTPYPIIPEPCPLREVSPRRREKAGINSPFLCRLRYKISKNEYEKYGFATLSPSKRREYISLSDEKRLYKKLNKKANLTPFSNRTEFFKVFGELCGRKYYDPENGSGEDLRAFLDGVDAFVIKPKNGETDGSLHDIEPTDVEILSSFNDRLKSEGNALEEYIIQHQDTVRLCKSAVNTLYIVTRGGEIIYGIMRTGDGKHTVDCKKDGGLFALIDLESGKIRGHARDENGGDYEFHPVSNMQFNGYPLPYMPEIKALAMSGAEFVKDVRFVGFNIAITVAGPVIVSATPTPSFEEIQILARLGTRKLL